MKARRVNRVFLDLDGCLNAGPEHGGGTVFSKEYPFNWKPELSNILEFLKFRDSNNLLSHIVTGRSVRISEALVHLFANAPSVLEHGTIIYDPEDKIREKHLIEVDGQYLILREAKEKLEDFIIRSAPNLIHEIQAQFPNYRIRMRLDNIHIWTLEFSPANLEFAEKLKEFINKAILPTSLIKYIQGKQLKELVSSIAFDLLPAVSKKAALKSLIEVKEINVSTSLGIGDSFHSDDWLELIIKGGGAVGCPANSDERLKEMVRGAGKQGYVAREKYFLGSMEILRHFIDNS